MKHQADSFLVTKEQLEKKRRDSNFYLANKIKLLQTNSKEHLLQKNQITVFTKKEDTRRIQVQD